MFLIIRYLLRVWRRRQATAANQPAGRGPVGG
jgi:hypothetical protein